MTTLTAWLSITLLHELSLYSGLLRLCVLTRFSLLLLLWLFSLSFKMTFNSHSFTVTSSRLFSAFEVFERTSVMGGVVAKIEINFLEIIKTLNRSDRDNLTIRQVLTLKIRKICHLHYLTTSHYSSSSPWQTVRAGMRNTFSTASALTRNVSFPKHFDELNQL